MTNQLRQRAGTPGTPVYTTGGRALGYYASIRLDLRPLEHLKDGGRVVGSRIRVQVIKNKLAPAWQSAELELLSDRGVLGEAGLLDPGVAAGLVTRSGGWYAYDACQLGQGRAQAGRFLAEHPDLAGELEGRLRVHLGLAVPEAASA